MKRTISTILTVLLYCVLVLVASVSALWFFGTLIFGDIVHYYKGGILRPILFLVYLASVVLPIIKYRRYEKKWVLPTVLSVMLIITPVFINGIIDFAEESMKTFTVERWQDNKWLREYMLDDLETYYPIKGRDEAYIKKLLGEPESTQVAIDGNTIYYYPIGDGWFDPVRYYIKFSDGVVVETGKMHT